MKLLLLLFLTACSTPSLPGFNRCDVLVDTNDRDLCRVQVSCERIAIQSGNNPNSCYEDAK